jgi:hypothetical protein
MPGRPVLRGVRRGPLSVRRIGGKTIAWMLWLIQFSRGLFEGIRF